MFTYETLSAYPRAFVSLTGLQIKLFDALHEQQAVMDTFPDVRLIIDTYEKRVRHFGSSDSEGTSRQKALVFQQK